MSTSQNILKAILKGPMTAGEIAAAIGESEPYAKKTLSALMHTKHVVRQTGIDQTVEYKITSEGRQRCIRNKLEHSAIAATDDAESPAAADDREADPVIIEEPPVPAVEPTANPMTDPIDPDAPAAPVVDPGVLDDEQAPAEEEITICEIPAEIPVAFPAALGYALLHPEQGLIRAGRSEDKALARARTLSNKTGKSIRVFRLQPIGTAVPTAVFIRVR